MVLDKRVKRLVKIPDRDPKQADRSKLHPCYHCLSGSCDSQADEQHADTPWPRAGGHKVHTEMTYIDGTKAIK